MKVQRFLVTADTHKPNDRTKIGPWYEANKKIVDLAKQMKVTGLVCPGDTGVDCRGSNEAQNCDMVSLIRPLAEAGIDYYVIDGNHDRRGSSEREVTTNSWIGNLKDADIWKHTHYWNLPGLYNVGDVQFLPLPYPPKHLFALGKEMKGADDMTAAASAYLLECLQANLKNVDPSKSLIIPFHGTIASPDLKIGSERFMKSGHEVSIPINAFPEWDNLVVACGHIHLRQILKQTPFIFYPGNLVPSEHDNEDQEPGVMYIEFRDGKFFHSEFYPVATVQYKTFRMSLADIPADVCMPEAFIAAIVVKQYEPAVRARTTLRVVLTMAQTRVIDSSALTDALLNLGFIDVSINKLRAEEKTLKEVKDKVNAELGVSHEDHLKAFINRDVETQDMIKAAGVGIDEILLLDGQMRQEVQHE